MSLAWVLPSCRLRAGLAAALVTPLLVVVAASGGGPASAAVPPAENPQIDDSCGVDVTLVLDASGSVSSSHAVDDVRNAADSFLQSLSNTNSTARVTQFASLAQQLAPRTQVDTSTLGRGGALRNAVDGYYNPIPPRPGNVEIKRYNGGNLLSASSFSSSNSSTQYTNWDQSLRQAAETTPELVVYVTDGDPTAYDFDKPGDPFSAGPPPDVAVGTDRTSASEQATLDRAVEEANRVKLRGSRMLAVGVGSALNNPASANRLVQIAGPQVVRDTDLGAVDSLNDIDVALVTDFEDLAALMRGVVLQLCSPSLTIRKLAQTPESASYDAAPGWDMTVTPRVPGGTFGWILPDTSPAASKTLTTDANGFAQFQWEPAPPEANSAATVAETLRPGYTAGRPGADNDYRCELRNEDNDVRVVEGDFADPADPVFDLAPIGQEIVTCAVYNSFDYAPAIALTKVNAPTEVRGDLDPPATVTSSYTVTNPGNTPLSNVGVGDDRCGPATPRVGRPNAGDTDGDVLLDPGETWEFTCDREITTPGSTDPDGLTIVNTADVSGTDPTGALVTDTATDDVAAFNPAVALTKQVNGQDQVILGSGATATYTYRATNTGNTPLGSVTLVDDTPPCQAPTRGPDDPGNGDAVLGVGETWTYSCVANPTTDVHNTATVTGVPLKPAAGNQPFPDPNPVVTATADARVTVVNPDIRLSKEVDPEIVLIGPDGAAEQVTYTFTAVNPGDEPLNRVGASDGGPGTTDPGWVRDSRCTAPPTYVDGDANGNELLDPGEEWHFTCTGSVTATTLNIALLAGQPSDDQGTPLPGVDPVLDLALAVVQVLRPGIDVVKTALEPVVLDPDAGPVSGPDVPTPRPARYTYEVTNTGNVPLSLSANPPVDDTCSPLVFDAASDADTDGLLDPDEVWTYTCQTTLERQQGNRPPVTGDESGLVQNSVTVTGVPSLDGELYPDKTVTAEDIAQVLVIEPGLSITKTASPEAVVAGDSVTYTFVVENTGDVGLDPIGPTDDKCSPLVLTGGDRNDNGLIDGADSAAPESWTYRCTRSIGLPEAPATTDVNAVEVSAVDPLGNTYTATDTAAVRVIAPAINLEKTVSDSLVPAGTNVDYAFLVTNAGQSPIPADDVLGDVILGDVSSPANPACRTPVLVAKEGGNQDDLLDRVPAETWRYACQGRIDERTVDIAVVGALGGSTIDSQVPVLDFAGAFVDAFHPGIAVEKTASPRRLREGGDVTYTYRVRNTGDVPLADVAERISDDTCSPVEYVSGDKDGDGLLDTPDSIFEDRADETWLFTCTTFVDEDTVNTVVVEGTPTDAGGEQLCGPGVTEPRVTQPCDVNDRDRARVTVTGPGPDIQPGGGQVPGHGPGGLLPNTGAPPWTGTLLALGLLLVLLGAGLVGSSVRPRGGND